MAMDEATQIALRILNYVEEGAENAVHIYLTKGELRGSMFEAFDQEGLWDEIPDVIVVTVTYDPVLDLYVFTYRFNHDYLNDYYDKRSRAVKGLEEIVKSIKAKPEERIRFT